MAWSIEHALKSKHNMRIIVSTDSEEYAEIARKYGAEVLLLDQKKFHKTYQLILSFLNIV